jgi:hypothetical protein
MKIPIRFGWESCTNDLPIDLLMFLKQFGRIVGPFQFPSRQRILGSGGGRRCILRPHAVARGFVVVGNDFLGMMFFYHNIYWCQRNKREREREREREKEREGEKEFIATKSIIMNNAVQGERMGRRTENNANIVLFTSASLEILRSSFTNIFSSYRY